MKTREKILIGHGYRRSAVAAVAAFALILQSFLAVNVMAAISADAGDGYRTILICTGDGYRQITLDAENKPTEQPAPSDATNECPACVLASSITLIQPVPVYAAHVRADIQNFVPTRQKSFVDELPSRSHRSRAPPHSAPL